MNTEIWNMYGMFIFLKCPALVPAARQPICHSQQNYTRSNVGTQNKPYPVSSVHKYPSHTSGYPNSICAFSAWAQIRNRNWAFPGVLIEGTNEQPVFYLPDFLITPCHAGGIQAEKSE